MAGLNYFNKGDYFTFFHPKYPKSRIVGKIMIVEYADKTHLEPKSNDLVVRRYSIKYCTKVKVCECATMHYSHHMNTQDINGKCTMCNLQRV
jgi:hypothetical protein